MSDVNNGEKYKRFSSRTFWMVIVWLALIPISVIIQMIVPAVGPEEIPILIPLGNIVSFAGLVCMAFVGLDKGGKIIAAINTPTASVDFVGISQVSLPSRLKSRTFWIAMIWLIYSVAVIFCQPFVKVELPMAQMISFAGSICAIFVSGSKGERMAVVAKTK